MDWREWLEQKKAKEARGEASIEDIERDLWESDRPIGKTGRLTDLVEATREAMFDEILQEAGLDAVEEAVKTPDDLIKQFVPKADQGRCEFCDGRLVSFPGGGDECSRCNRVFDSPKLKGKKSGLEWQLDGTKWEAGQRCPKCAEEMTPKPARSWYCDPEDGVGCGQRLGPYKNPSHPKYKEKGGIKVHVPGGKVVGHIGKSHKEKQRSFDYGYGSSYTTGKGDGSELSKAYDDWFRSEYSGKSSGKSSYPSYTKQHKDDQTPDWWDKAVSLFGGKSGSKSYTYTPKPKWTSAGGVVIHSLDANGINYIYLRKPSNNYGPWSFPKGRVEEGEQIEQVAIREVREELGLKCKMIPSGYLGKHEGSSSYTHFYLMVRIGGSTVQHDWESESVKLFTWEEAEATLKKAGNSRDAKVLAIAREKIQPVVDRLAKKVVPD